MKWLLDLIGLPSPYALLTYIVVAVGLFGMGTYTGWHEKSLRVDAAKAETVQLQLTTYQVQAGLLNEASARTETKLEDIRYVFLILNKSVDALVANSAFYAGECFDADGVSLINAAIADKAPDPGKPRPALRVTIPAGERNAGGGAP